MSELVLSSLSEPSSVPSPGMRLVQSPLLLVLQLSSMGPVLGRSTSEV